jgi:hypothetical protein
MKSAKDYSDYLNDIIQYARKAEGFLTLPFHDQCGEGNDSGPQNG